jgi:hypothetical protein
VSLLPNLKDVPSMVPPSHYVAACLPVIGLPIGLVLAVRHLARERVGVGLAVALSAYLAVLAWGAVIAGIVIAVLATSSPAPGIGAGA